MKSLNPKNPQDRERLLEAPDSCPCCGCISGCICGVRRQDRPSQKPIADNLSEDGICEDLAAIIADFDNDSPETPEAARAVKRQRDCYGVRIADLEKQVAELTAERDALKNTLHDIAHHGVCSKPRPKNKLALACMLHAITIARDALVPRESAANSAPPAPRLPRHDFGDWPPTIPGQ